MFLLNYTFIHLLLQLLIAPHLQLLPDLLPQLLISLFLQLLFYLLLQLLLVLLLQLLFDLLLQLHQDLILELLLHLPSSCLTSSSPSRSCLCLRPRGGPWSGQD